MRRYKPLVIWPLLSFFFAGAFWLRARSIDPGLERDIFILATFTMIGALMFTGIEYLLYVYGKNKELISVAHVIGDLKLMEGGVSYHNSIMAMNSDQLLYAMRQRPKVRLIPGHGTAPLYIIVMPNGVEVPRIFAHDFLAESVGTYLVERRRFSEGSSQHLWADTLTNFFIAHGYAEDAQGNHSAHWISERMRDEGLASIGYQIDVHGRVLVLLEE